MKKYKSVLSIAGSDSSGGAGIQADIKAISACGCYAATVITALTAQNTCGVTYIHIPELEVFTAQLNAVLDDLKFDAIKIGMLPSGEYAEVLAESIKKYELKNVVLDPVMVATSNDRLIDDASAESIIKNLLPLATIITPNIPEAEYLSGIKINSVDDFELAADKIKQLGAKNILIKGGHNLGQGVITDRLFMEDGSTVSYLYQFQNTVNTHGTGCSLSSAIAAYLAKGESIASAVRCADDYLHKALDAGSQYFIGQGHGPVNHFML